MSEEQTQLTTEQTANATPTPEAGAGKEASANVSVGSPIDTGATGTDGKPVIKEAATPAEAIFTPNFKYKVKDKELEMAPWIHSAVKNKAHEDELRDLYTKAGGIDEIKAERDDFKGKFGKLEPEFKELTQSLDTLSSYVRDGDFGKFFQALRIPEQSFLQYAVDRLRYHQLPKEERAALDERAREKESIQSLAHSKSSLEEALNRQAIQTRELEYNFAASQPDVAGFIQSFESAVGAPGAFRQKVIERGILEHQLTGKDLNAGEVIAKVMQEFGHFIKPQVQAGMPGPGATTGMSGAQSKPVIPNINSAAGTGASPVKKTYKSLDEIRALTSK